MKKTCMTCSRCGIDRANCTFVCVYGMTTDDPYKDFNCPMWQKGGAR